MSSFYSCPRITRYQHNPSLDDTLAMNLRLPVNLHSLLEDRKIYRPLFTLSLTQKAWYRAD